jgi:hypothetical protein
MRRVTVLLSLVLLPVTAVLMCKSEEKSPRQDPTIKAAGGNSMSKRECEMLITRLARFHDRLRTAGDDSLKDALVAASWDSTAGGFICLGKGVVNPKLPQAVWHETQHKAALLTAERWALYLKKWRDKQYVATDHDISGQVVYHKEICACEKEDTLWQLVMIPLGSISVH